MRMDGDPHFTAWGSLDAEPIGGQRALIPSQEVGGYFLMGTEEKEPSRPQTPHGHGGPLFCLCDEPLLQPLGVVDGHGQLGEEDTPVTRSALDLSLYSSETLSSYCTLESPPKSAHSPSQVPDENGISPIRSPQEDRPSHDPLDATLQPETDLSPLCAPDAGQMPVPEQNVISSSHFFQNDHPSDDLLDVPEPTLPPDTDPLPLCPPLCAADASQVPVPDQNVFSHSPKEGCPSDDLLDIHQLLLPDPNLPREIDPLPVCPLVCDADASQVPVHDQNVISSHKDFPSSDLHQLLVPEPALPPETDPLPHCAPNSSQMPVPSNSMLAVDETLLFTSKTHQENDCNPLFFDYLTPETDQCPPAESCLPHIDDHSLLPEAPVGPCTDNLPQLVSIVDSAVVELPESESSLDFGALTQSSSQFVFGAAPLPQSESCPEPDLVRLPHSYLNIGTDSLSQSHWHPNPFCQSECCLDSDVDELPEAETCLNLSMAELPEADSCALSDINDLAEAENFLNPEGDLPEAEACLDFGASELPESDTCLDPGIGDLPEAESFAVPDVSELPEAEAGLNAGSELTEAELDLANFNDYLPQSESCLQFNVDQLPQSDSCLNLEELSHAEPCLHPDTDWVSCPEPCLNPNTDLLLMSEPCLHSDANHISCPETCLDPDADPLPVSEPRLHPDTNQFSCLEPLLDHDSNLLPLSESCLHPDANQVSCLDLDANQVSCSEPCLEPDADPLPVSAPCLHPDTDQFSCPEPLLDHDSNILPLSESCLHPDANQVSCLDLDTNQVSCSEPCLDPDTDLLPMSEHYLHPDANHVSCPEPCLDHDADLLPMSEPFFTADPDQIPQIESHLHSGACKLAQPETLMNHSFNYLKFNLTSGSELLTKSDGILNPDTNKSPQATECSDADSSLLEYCLHPDPVPLPTFHSLLDSEPDQIPQSEPILNTDDDQIYFLSQSEPSIALEVLPVGEPCSASEQSEANLGQNPDLPECCLNSQCDQVPDAYLDQKPKLVHSAFNLKVDQSPLTDFCPQSEPNQSPQSDCLLIPKSAQCSLSEPCLDSDMLFQTNSNLEVDSVQLSKSELSFVPGACPSSASILPPVTDHLPGLCLDSDDELLPLAETFLAHENEHLPCSFSESDSGFSHSKTSSTTDQMSLFSDLTDQETSGSEAAHSDHLDTSESPSTNISDQLPISESSSCDDAEFFSLGETFLAYDTDQVSLLALPGDREPAHLPLSIDDTKLLQLNLPKSPDIHLLSGFHSVCDTDDFNLGESFLSHDALPFTKAYSNDHVPELSEACLGSDSGHFLELEDNNQVSLSESSVPLNYHEMPPPDPPLSSHADQFSPSEPFSADKFPLCNSSVANTGHLPLLESYLDHDNFSKFDSSLQSHLPLSDSVVVGDGDQFIESSTDHQIPQPKSFHDFDLLNLPECLFAPNFKDLNLPDFDPFHLDMHPGDPGTEMSLFDELLACNANQTLLPESIATPTSDELSLVDSCLQNYGDHVLPSHMSVPPNEDQLPFTDPNPALKKDDVQLCQSLTSSKVEHPLSESFLESSADQQLPQSDLASEVDQPNSAHQSTLESTSEFSQISPANTGFSNSIVEEFQIPWDWTSDLHHAEFTGVVLDGNSDIYLNLTPDDGDSQVHEIDDCFSLFCLDTPPKSPIASPEIDPLTLSDDLLSLCDVFSQLQSNDPISPESNIELCCALDSLSLHQTEEFTTDQLPIIKEEIFSPVNDPQSDNIPASNEHACLNAHDRTFNGISDHSLNQTDSYCLDLLFEPKLVSCETQCSPTSPAANPCPQLLFDPTFRDVTSATVPGHCDVTTPTHSHVYTTQSALPQESLCCSNEHLPPAGQSDSPLHRVKSSSHVDIEMGSTAELLGKTLQLPLILGKEPLDLLDDLPENNQDVLLSKSEEALPPDKFEPEMDNPIEDEEVPPCNVNEHALFRSEQPDRGQISAGLSDSIEQSVPNDTTQSKLDTDFENLTSTPCGPVEQIEKVALSRTVSPLENTQVLPCDSHQDSASATFSFGEGDPFLGFALDNDSPCVGDELARLRAVFNALDRDKDGFVKMEDFVQFATVYGAEQVKYLTGYLDPAGLGVINFRDFYRGISEIQNEDLDMQLYDMGYPSEGEPACSVDFDDLAAFEVTEVTDSAYVGSESAYSECETFTDEDTGGLTAQEDPETEGDGAGSRRHTSASPEGLELSLCDISVVTVAGQEEQFEDFGEGAEPDLFNSHCEDETDSFTQTSNSTKRLTSSGAPVSERQLLAPPPCSALGGMYCSQCHKHINRLEDLSTRLRYLEMDSPDKRTYSRKEARRLHHNGFLGEEPEEQQQTEMAYDDTDLTDKVLYLEQRVSELERDAATTNEQQNRLRQENLQLLHRVHALEEQLKDQELLSDEVQSEETRKHRDELRKMERDRSYRLSSLKARLQELENENTELRSQLPGAKATTQRLEEEKLKLLDQIEDLQHQLQEHQEQNRKLGGKLSKEMHKQQTEKERCQEVIEELRRELEQMQLMRLEMEQRMGLGNSAALQEYNSRTREAELEQEVRRLKQEQRILKEQNEELNGQIINLSIQGAKNLFSTTFSDSLAAEISSVSRDELMEAIQKQEEINLRLQDYIDRIIVAIMETNPAILEVKIH